MLNPTSAPIPGLNNQSVSVPVAAVVGGGSVVNGMAYMRGAKDDYDAWEELGNPGWTWDGLLPYFRKSTDYLPPGKAAASQWNITWDEKWYGSGPVKVTVPEFQYDDLASVIEAWETEGVVAKVEMGAGGSPGLYWVPETIDKRDGTRVTSWKAYFDPVKSRANLQLLTGHTVDEILFLGKKATGVRITSRSDNRISEVYARKEIILAAGAIQTPQLLQVSGIGPRDVLEAVGIKVKKDLPGVGANLQDHATVVTTYALEHQSFPNYDSVDTNPTYNASAWEQYFFNRTGPVASGTGSTVVLFPLPQLNTTLAPSIAQSLLSQNPASHLPSIYTTSPTLLAGFLAQRRILASRYLSNTAAVSSGAIIGTGFAATPFLKPASCGTVTLNSTDPKALPIVQYNTLSVPTDTLILIAMLRRTRARWLSANPILRSAFGTITEATPGLQYQTDAEMVAALRGGWLLPALAHASGTCAMMAEKLGACVGSDLRVHEVQGLSVVDTSVMPLTVGGGLQASVYAIAEKAADLVKGRA